MKSIFNKKKRIIDPYYLVAPPTQPNPTRPSSRLGWRRDGGRDGWMDGWMEMIKGEIPTHSIICRNMLA